MLSDYVRATMRRAQYEILADDGSFYGEIPGFAGVYANAGNLETCRQLLEEVLEAWMLFRISRGLALPIVDGIDLTIREVAWIPPFGPIKRKDLIRYLRRVGFAGPFAGGRHEFMVQGDLSLWIPNPHSGDIGRELLARILRQANISREEWERL